MRTLILLAGATLSLSACGGGESETNQVDLSVNNLVVDDTATANALMNGDANMMMGTGNALDANGQNAVMEDLTTNVRDTNLANGL